MLVIWLNHILREIRLELYDWITHCEKYPSYTIELEMIKIILYIFEYVWIAVYYIDVKSYMIQSHILRDIHMLYKWELHCKFFEIRYSLYNYIAHSEKYVTNWFTHFERHITGYTIEWYILRHVLRVIWLNRTVLKIC